MLEQVPRILSFIHQRSDEDSVNRLVSFYSVVILSLSVLLVSAKQYVGSPLQCWVPAHFTGAMEQYTENYCWIENTWYYPIKSKLPWLPQTREDAKISYYQWVPFLLLLQCFFCFLPPRFWAFVNGCSGHDPKSVMKSARACRSLTDGSAHNTTISQIAEHLYKPRDVRLDTISSALRRNFNRYSILVAYILSKCFYFIVILLQFWAMMRFLDINNPFFGYKMYEDLVNNINWEQTGIFPRVTMCDFEVKVMGNLHRYTVQCVLLINMFNEKIFMLLWFWFAVLIFVFAGSICYWCAFMIDRFVDNFLGPDVVFLLVLLKGHGGNIILSEVLLELWKKYKSVPSLMQNGSHKVKIYPDKSSKKSHKEKPSVFVSRHNHRNDADERGNEFVENGLYKRPERLNLKLLDELAAVDENPEDQQQNDDVGYKVNYPPIPPPYARAQRNDNSPEHPPSPLGLHMEAPRPTSTSAFDDDSVFNYGTNGAEFKRTPSIIPFTTERQKTETTIPMNDRHSDPGRSMSPVATAVMVPLLLRQYNKNRQMSDMGRLGGASRSATGMSSSRTGAASAGLQRGFSRRMNTFSGPAKLGGGISSSKKTGKK